MSRTCESPPRRIALFTGNLVNVVDGVALTLNRLVQFLRQRGDEVVVFAPGAQRYALEPAAEFVPVPAIVFGLQPEYRVAVGLTPRIKRRLAALQPDLVHVATPDLLGRAAIRYARRQQVPVVGSFHTNIASYFRYLRWAKWVEPLVWRSLRRFYNRCDRCYVPTPSMDTELRAHGFTVPTEIWARGVDTQRFSPTRRDSAWRRQHEIADDEVVVLFVARLRWEKGLHLLADVFQRLDQRGLRYRPVIVGDGVGYGMLRSKLPRAVMTGSLSGDALAVAYASSDLFLYPSETDTFGNVTLEAMASGLPTICADAPGSKSLVQPAVTGALVTPGDADAFALATERLIVDQPLRQRQSNAALVRAGEFSWTECFGALSDSYDAVLRRSMAGASAVHVGA